MIRPESWDWLDTTLNAKLRNTREVYSSQELSPAIKNHITKSLNEKSHQTLHQSRQILFKFSSSPKHRFQYW